VADPVFVDDVTPLTAVNLNKLQTRDEKAAANGYPSLDSGGKVPVAQLPAVGAALSYDGDWVAGTYQDGQVVVKDGIAYLCVGGPTAVAPDPAPWGMAALASRPSIVLGPIVGPWPVATTPGPTDGAPFTVTVAGTYLITVAASCYRTTLGPVNIAVWIDGVNKFTIPGLFSASMTHYSLIPQSALVALTAGTHYLALVGDANTSSDSGDFASMTAVYT